jgi:hypothetical protein
VREIVVCESMLRAVVLLCKVVIDVCFSQHTYVMFSFDNMNVVVFISRRVECFCSVARQLAIQRHVSSTLDLQAREYVSVNVNFIILSFLALAGCIRYASYLLVVGL